MKFYLPTFSVIIISLLVHCDKLKEKGKERIQNSMKGKPATKEDIEKWKERLNLTEAEIKELDKQIRKLVNKTNEAGTLSWKIARAYMRSGNYELGMRHYNQAIKENAGGKNLPEFEIHNYESSVLHWDKTLLYKSLNEDLLFEAGLAYANAARDRGWEKQRTEVAIEIFKSLITKNPEESKYPYELALIYFDSSLSYHAKEENTPTQTDNTEKAFNLLNKLILKTSGEPTGIPFRFARANFLYRIGKVAESEKEYLFIKNQIEDFKGRGIIRESLEELQSYKNVIENLKKIQDGKLK